MHNSIAAAYRAGFSLEQSVALVGVGKLEAGL